MGIMDRLFKRKSNNSNNSKKSNKSNKTNKSKNSNNSKKNKKKPSALFRNTRTRKLKRPKSSKVYSLQKFEKKFGQEMPKFKKNLQGNVVIMYDPNTPDGEESSNQKTYIHYLQVKKEVVIDYQAPNPPKGTHNYYSVSMLIKDKDTLNSLKTMDPNNRVPMNIQELHIDKKLFNYQVEDKDVLRINHFKVKAN